MIRGYYQFVQWLLGDSLGRWKRTATAVLAAGVAGVGFQVAVFALVIYYARHFSGGELIAFGGADYSPRSSVGLLIVGSVVIVAFLSLAAACIYYARRTVVRLGREYEEVCAKRVLSLLARGGDLLSLKSPDKGADSYLIQLMRSDSRIAGRVLRKILILIIPGTTLAVATVVLAYLEVGLTVLLAGLGCVFLFYQYRVSRKAAEHSLRFEKVAPAAGQEYKDLVHRFRHIPRPEAGGESVERLFEKGPVRKQLDAYEGRLRAVENSRLVSGIFMAVGIGVIVVVMGGAIIHQGTGWGRLLIYVVALRFAMVNLQVVFSSITTINRFYPQMRRYMMFVQAASRGDQKRYPPVMEHRLRTPHTVEEEVLEGDVAEFPAGSGSIVGMVTPQGLNRYTLAGLCWDLAETDETAAYGILNGARYASTSHSSPEMSLRRALGLSEDATWSELRSWFPGSALWEKARTQLPGSLDKKIGPVRWEKVSPELKFLLSLISARIEGCSWLFLEAGGLDRLGRELASAYLDNLSDMVTVVVHTDRMERVGHFGEEVVAVSDGDRLLGLGSPEWFASIQESVADSVIGASRNGGKQRRNSAADDDDSLDDDME